MVLNPSDHAGCKVFVRDVGQESLQRNGEMMNVGDLIRCGKEIGIIIDTEAQPRWLSILWEDGDIEGISPEDVDEVLNASR